MGADNTFGETCFNPDKNIAAMKTLILKLKKDVLIVDSPIDSELTAIGNDKVVYYEFKHDYKEDYTKVANGKEWKLLCQGTPTEEQAAELVTHLNINYFHDYFYDYEAEDYGYQSAVESFLSAVSAENWYWLVNPYEDYKAQTIDHYKEWEIMYKEAEPRTFKNPYIFIKE